MGRRVEAEQTIQIIQEYTELLADMKKVVLSLTFLTLNLLF